jgi:hypothetical protein
MGAKVASQTGIHLGNRSKMTDKSAKNRKNFAPRRYYRMSVPGERPNVDTPLVLALFAQGSGNRPARRLQLW